nr:hypothetical protein [Tanacetum cinerariifolium]
MTLTFAETHNMIAYLIKSDASEGFNQIIDFLNGSSIKLQALVDKKRVVVTEATIRDAFCLDDAEGVECLPNEEIFAELARMGYEKPFAKLTFYKAFFSSQWKFSIHTILQCMSSKRTSWNEFSSSMALAVICLSIGKGFSRVETPLFKGMIVEQQVAEGDDDEVHNGGVFATGVVAEGDVSAANDEVPTADEEPSILSPTPPTPPPQPSQDFPSTSQDARIPMNLLQELLDTCTALIKRVEHLELDKVAQAMEITKLKQRVKKLNRRNKVNVLKLKSLQKVGTRQRVETSDDTIMDDVSNQGRMIAEMNQDVDVVLKDDKEEDETEPTKVQKVVEVVTTAKLITKVVTAASEIITAASTTITAAEAQVPAATLTATPSRVTAAPSRRRKRVVIRDPHETETPSTIIPVETKSKDKEAKLNKNIDWDEVIDHVNKKAKEDPAVKRYQALKRKPQTEAQERKNMMIYLKNVAGFKMDYFKGMSYDDIRPIFEAKFNTNVAFLQKIKEQIIKEESRALKRLNETPAEKAAKRQKLDKEVEELKRHLQIVPNEEDDVYTEATPLALKVPVVDYEIYNKNNKPYYKNKRADGSHQLYLSFLSLLRNFDREDLEALWSLVKEIFATTKPKNFSDDFLLITLGAMFEKPDIHAQIWKIKEVYMVKLKLRVGSYWNNVECR